MLFLLIVLFICFGQHVATSSERLHIEVAHSKQTEEIPDLNYPPPPESVTEEQKVLPKNFLKRVPKGMTPEQFRLKETERKRIYREQKGPEWRRIKWRRNDAARREKYKKVVVLSKIRTKLCIKLFTNHFNYSFYTFSIQILEKHVK